MDKHLHIIVPDIPFPINHGAAYDIYYKLQALQQQGVFIHLHCLAEEVETRLQLNLHCTSVDYYEKQQGLKLFFQKTPYAVATCSNEKLVQNLLKDDHPILMDGIQCSRLVTDKRFISRRKFIRMRAIEHKRYKQLLPLSHSLKNKIYYAAESRAMKKYESNLVNRANGYWPVSVSDTNYFKKQMHFKDINTIPLFLPSWEIKTHYGRGVFCLYHGRLDEEENIYAALWLMTRVFNDIDVPFVIAGKNPGSKLLEKAKHYPNTCVIANPAEKEMDDMVFKAHIHVLPSFSTTGIKLKLLNALYNGRHCVVNDGMIKHSGLQETCHIANEAEQFKEVIQQLYHQPFTKEETSLRKQILQQQYSNEASARQMIGYIWEGT